MMIADKATGTGTATATATAALPLLPRGALGELCFGGSQIVSIIEFL
jgi:hypothetical protein